MVLIMKPLTDLLNLAYNYSLNQSKKHCLDQDELFSECQLILVQLIKEWSPEHEGYKIEHVLLHKFRFVVLKMKKARGSNVEHLDAHKVIRDRVGVSWVRDHDMVEYTELVNHLCRTPTEREYVELKLSGHKQYEIVGLLGLSPWSQRRIEDTLHERYIEWCGD